jgi:transketolase
LTVLLQHDAEVDAPFSRGLLAIAEARPDIVVLSGDLSKYTDIHEFAQQFPSRFIQLGMAEQNMMGVAGGLAKTGFVPIAVTYGVFATRRAGEQIQMALSTGPGRPAVVVAFLPGITTPFTATHQATDDLSIMRAVPGMTVIDPADATDMEDVLSAVVNLSGPAYVRGLRARVRRVIDPTDYRFTVGKTYELRPGSDAGMISTGLGTQWALDAATLLAEEGVDTAVLHVPTIKPADGEAIAEFCARFRAVTTIENHSIIGGLGSMVAEVIAECLTGTRLHRLGVPDVWAPVGDVDYIRRNLGLDADSIASRIREVSGGG